MSVVAVVIVKGGMVADSFTYNDDDDIFVVDMDQKVIGMCPVCSEGLKFGVCPECMINWNTLEDTADVANRLLHHA